MDDKEEGSESKGEKRRNIIFGGSYKAPENEETRKIIINAMMGLNPELDLILQIGQRRGVDRMVREGATQLGFEVDRYKLPNDGKTAGHSITPSATPTNIDGFYILRRKSEDKTSSIGSVMERHNLDVLYMFHWDIINSSGALQYLGMAALKHSIPKRFFLIPAPEGYKSPVTFGITLSRSQTRTAPSLALKSLGSSAPRLTLTGRETPRKWRTKMYEEQEKMDDTTPRWFKPDKDAGKEKELNLTDETRTPMPSPPMKVKERKKKRTRHKKRVSFPQNDTYSVPNLHIELEKKIKVVRRHSNTEDIGERREKVADCYRCAMTTDDLDNAKLEERSHTALDQRFCYHCSQVVSQESIAEDTGTGTPHTPSPISPSSPLTLPELKKTNSGITKRLCDLLLDDTETEM